MFVLAVNLFFVFFGMDGGRGYLSPISDLGSALCGSRPDRDPDREYCDQAGRRGLSLR